MGKFIGVKLVEAEPAKAIKPSGRYEKEDPGYQVKYSDGYVSWCPKGIFEQQNLPIQGTANKIHPGDVEAMIKNIKVATLENAEGKAKTTVVVCTLINEFVITESSSCVDPVNYDEKVGKDICMEKIRNKIWFLLGFLLQSAVNGFDRKEVV